VQQKSVEPQLALGRGTAAVVYLIRQLPRLSSIESRRSLATLFFPESLPGLLASIRESLLNALMDMPAGARSGRAFMIIRLKEPLRRLPQMQMMFSIAIYPLLDASSGYRV
jgi:hypothetical protein